MSTDRTPLEWKWCPADADPSKRIIIFGIAATLAGVVYVWGQNAAYSLLAIAAVLFSTSEYWKGMKFRLGDEFAESGVFVIGNQMRWSDVKTVTLGTDRIKLSPLPKSQQQNAFRGLSLRFSESERERVTEFVLSRIPEDAEQLGLEQPDV
jgi:hypothetical protein